MDLGITGKKALVCGASAGLGLACAQALVQEGVDVVIVARTEGPLVAAAAGLTALQGGRVERVVADVASVAVTESACAVSRHTAATVVNANS